MILYGSRARGDHEADSDVDILIVLRDFRNKEAELDRVNGILNELSLDHEVVIACHVVRERDYRRRQSPLLINIRREGVRL